jgi:hypothetical protein
MTMWGDHDAAEIAYEHEARRRSYELIADAFELEHFSRTV